MDIRIKLGNNEVEMHNINLPTTTSSIYSDSTIRIVSTLIDKLRIHKKR